MKLIHLSDLHVSSEWFVSEWGDAVVSYVNEARPDVTVVTGDLTEEGQWGEYEKASGFMARLDAGALLVVPGNHDARNGGYLRFEEVFGTRFPSLETSTAIICGIDSNQPDTDEGRIGPSSIVQIADTVSLTDKVRILAMHHHLVPVPGSGCGRPVPADADEVLRLCADTDMDIVLSGHGHRPHVASRGCTYFVTAGSATLWKADGRSFPSFNVISVERDTIYVQLVDVTGGWGTQTIAAARLRRARTDGDCRPRVTPPLAFEAEEFHSQIPDDDWRLRHGVPQTLDFPAFRY